MSRIRELRELRGWSQAELGRRAGMSQPVIARLETGERPLKVPQMEKLAHAFGVDAAELIPPRNGPAFAVTSAGNRAPEPPPKAVMPASVDPSQFGQMPLDLPVRGTALGGDDGAFDLNGPEIDRVRRPPSLAGARDAFAIFFDGTSMEPRYERGDILYINPARPPRLGDDVLIEMHPEVSGSPGLATVKRLERITSQEIVCRQFNPEQTIRFPRERVLRIFRVVPYRELLIW